MNRETVKKILEKVKTGVLSVEEATESLRSLPFEDMGFATVDHHRALRTGFPEVIFCQGKTTEQVVAITEKITSAGSGSMTGRRSVMACSTPFLAGVLEAGMINPVYSSVFLSRFSL